MHAWHDIAVSSGQVELVT